MYFSEDVLQATQHMARYASHHKRPLMMAWKTPLYYETTRANTGTVIHTGLIAGVI